MFPCKARSKGRSAISQSRVDQRRINLKFKPMQTKILGKLNCCTSCKSFKKYNRIGKGKLLTHSRYDQAIRVPNNNPNTCHRALREDSPIEVANQMHKNLLYHFSSLFSLSLEGEKNSAVFGKLFNPKSCIPWNLSTQETNSPKKTQDNPNHDK